MTTTSTTGSAPGSAPGSAAATPGVAPRPPSPTTLFLRQAMATLGFLVLVFGAWELLARFGPWPSYLFPAFSDVVVSLLAVVRNGNLAHAVAASVTRLATGYLMGLVAGLLLGLAMGRYKLVEATFGSIALGLQALPSVAWLPLALIWFGLSESAIVFVVVMGTVFAIAIATASAIHHLPHQLERAAQNLGARGYQLLLYLVLPAALPGIVQGMKQGWSFAWRSLIAAEMVYSAVGLGRLLIAGRELSDLSLVMAIMLVIVVVGLIADRLIFGRLEKAVQARWGLGRRDAGPAPNTAGG